MGVSSAGGGALLWRRHHRYGLTGQLLILQGPTDEPNPLPYDLGRKRTRRLGLGRQGKGIWRLPGWSGSARLLVDAQGMVLLAPEVRGGQAEEASVMLNGMAIYQPTILQDKDRIGCGPYQLQYENLLL